MQVGLGWAPQTAPLPPPPRLHTSQCPDSSGRCSTSGTKPRGHPLYSPQYQPAGRRTHALSPQVPGRAHCVTRQVLLSNRRSGHTAQTGSQPRMPCLPKWGRQTPTVCEGEETVLALGVILSVTATQLRLQREGARAKSYTSGHAARSNRTVYRKPAGWPAPEASTLPSTRHQISLRTWAERAPLHTRAPTTPRTFCLADQGCPRGLGALWLLNGTLKSQVPPKGSARSGNHSLKGKTPSPPVTTEWASMPQSKDALKHWRLIKKVGGWVKYL